MEIVKEDLMDTALETTPVLKNGTVDQEAVDKKQKEVDALLKDNKTKVYAIEVKTQKTLDLILDYLENKIHWVNMEAFGIPRIYDALKKEQIKNGSVYLTGLEVEALAFYLSKITGKGVEEAREFLLMKAAIDSGYNLRELDNKKEHAAMMQLEALRQGINISGVVEEVVEEDGRGVEDREDDITG